MKPNARQQEAIEYLNGPLLVLAGPGTGKTQLLSEKVKFILENTDANPENILCLTFTEAGASNMRERLLKIVGPTASGVNIHTYHAFGSDILAQYKNYAENFDRNLDEPIDQVTQYKIINNIISELPVTDILKTNEVKDIISTIAEAKSARLTAEDLKLIAETNITDTEKMNPRVSEILKEVQARMPVNDAREIYTRVGAVIAEFTSSAPITGKIQKEANNFLLSLNDVFEKLDAAEKPSVSLLTSWRNSLFEKDKNNNYRFKNYISNKKLLSLANVYAKYEAYLEENKLFDFSDMIEQAVRILKTDDGFRFTLQERYRYILLDEFQDTNPSQFELIRLVADPEKPDIMAVGDDDQAIFEFQGANASNLYDFQNEYNAKVVELTENYRSISEILDFSRKIGDQIEGSFAKKRGFTKTLTSVRNDEILAGEQPGKTHIKRHEFKAADAEYAWVASEVNKLVLAGEKQSDIAVITQKHKYVTDLLPYLKSYDNINIAYEKRENVLEDEHIMQITTLCRFIYELASGQNPAYRLLEILTFPFFQIPAIEAITSMQSYYGDTRSALEYLKNSTNENIQKVAYFLAELVAKSYNTPLELFIDYLVGTTPFEILVPGSETPIIYQSNFIKFYTGDNKTSFKTYNLYENLSVLREHIRSHVTAEKPRLADFINFLDDYEAAGEAILNTSPYQDSTNSVQIITAHKSKGLEYKHVFMIAVDDLSWGNSKGNNNKLTLPLNLQSIRHTGHTEDECLRLFFVAITRAKKTLVMTNSKQDFAGKSPKRLQYLQEYEESENDVRSPLLLDSNIVEHYEELPEDEKRENIKKHWMANYLSPTPELLPILRKKVENYRFNATALTTFIDIAYAGPITFYERYVIDGPREPADNSMVFGTLIHAVFEETTNNKLSDEAALEFFKSEVEKLDLDDATKADVLARGKISVKESLKAFREILTPSDGKVAKAEVNLSREYPMLGNIPLTGKIDHINIDEQNKTIEIYDFKTGGFHKEKWESHPTLYKYALQLEFYKLLLNNSPTYSKYKVTRAHILFVSPNTRDVITNELEGTSNDLVFDKVYEFTDESDKDARDLIAAVYSHIQMLDFIDEDSPLAVYPDTTRKIKDIKDFCDLVKNTQIRSE
jgi:DNA helicase-2/ATP-dependent DNA helicase PcrA